jgi:hypothetical protein
MRLVLLGPRNFQHLLLNCTFSHETWFRLLRQARFRNLVPTQDDDFPDWWLVRRKALHKDRRKGFDSLVPLVSWSLWLERNDRVFNKSRQAHLLASSIRDDGHLWVGSGVSMLRDFFL